MMTLQAQKPKILAVDDDQIILGGLRSILAKDYDFKYAKNGQEALKRLYDEPIDLVILDLHLPDIDGMDLLKDIGKRYPQVPVIMLTGEEDFDIAIRCMHLGAFYYVKKGTEGFADALKAPVVRALEQRRFDVQETGSTSAPTKAIGHHLIGHSVETFKLWKAITKTATVDGTVLITGETGSGKEVVAAEIRRQFDPDGKKPFVTLNCATISESLAESELFGHEKGAFTGAINRNPGKFVAANGGILFLDEMGELSPKLQAKLLRVLQEGVVTPVGSQKDIPVKVRVICATNRNLSEEVRAGRFREDLYYRISDFKIEVPSLRKHKRDISSLVEYFLKSFDANGYELTKEAMNCLEQYDWPGNIRALRRCIKQALANAKSDGRTKILKSDIELDNTTAADSTMPTLPSDFLPKAESDIKPGQLNETLEWVHRHYLERALEATGGNKKRLAGLLGISREYLHKRLRHLGLV